MKSLAVAVATVLAATDDPTGTSGLVFFVIASGVLVAISVVMGVFGREFALIAVALCGVWVTLTTVLIVRFVVDDTTDLLVGLVFVLALCVGAFFVARLGWFIGTVVCVSKGHFTSRDLSEIAYARSGRSSPGGSVYDDALEELVRRLAVGERVTARSMAIEHRSTWHRPLAVVATDRRLVMAPWTPRGNSATTRCRFRLTRSRRPRSEVSTGTAPRVDRCRATTTSSTSPPPMEAGAGSCSPRSPRYALSRTRHRIPSAVRMRYGTGSGHTQRPITDQQGEDRPSAAR